MHLCGLGRNKQNYRRLSAWTLKEVDEWSSLSTLSVTACSIKKIVPFVRAPGRFCVARYRFCQKTTACNCVPKFISALSSVASETFWKCEVRGERVGTSLVWDPLSEPWDASNKVATIRNLSTKFIYKATIFKMTSKLLRACPHQKYLLSKIGSDENK